MKRVNPDLGDKGGIINLTTGKFYRISGSSTQHKGVIPDIEFPTVFSADKYGESSEKAALPWDEIKSSNYTKFGNLSTSISSLKDGFSVRMKTNREYNYLLEDITEFNRRDAEVSLPLSEIVSKKQKDEFEAKTLNRENERRVFRGLTPLKKGEVKPAKEENYDFIRDETLQIITDFISNPKIAKNQKL